MQTLLMVLGMLIVMARLAVSLGLTSRRDRSEGDLWREFGLRNALAHMPHSSPGRAVIEALLAQGRLTDEEGRRFKAAGLRNALAHMPPDSPGHAVVEALLAREVRREAEADALSSDEPEPPRRQPSAAAKQGAHADVLDDLERLVRLREQGHLTDQEFDAAKRKLLG